MKNAKTNLGIVLIVLALLFVAFTLARTTYAFADEPKSVQKEEKKEDKKEDKKDKKEEKPEKQPMRGPLEGAWKLTSFTMGDNNMDGMTAGQTTMQIMVGGHFMWATYEDKTKAPLIQCGGTYTLAGTAYKEKYDFASEALAPLREGEQTLESKIQGDKWFLSGTIIGLKLKQTWERVK